MFVVRSALIALILASAGFPARAGTIRVEMETFFESHDLGGTPIYRKNCTAASQGMAVEGLDVDGEWLRIRVQVPHDHCFIDSLRSAAPVGEIRTFSVSIVPETVNEPALNDTMVTIPGRGIG